MIGVKRFVVIKKLLEEYNLETEVTILYIDQDDRLRKILEGNYYHDKIDSKIEGFFEALDFLGVKYEIERIG